MSKILKVLGIIVVVLFILGIFKDQLIKTIVDHTATKILGAKVDVGQFSLGLFNQSVRIKNFKIYNPPGFPQNELLLDIPEVSVDYDLGAMMKGNVHLKTAVFDLRQMTIIRNAEGKLNVDSLKVVEKGKEPAAGEPGKKESKQVALQIDLLKLNIGKVVFKDYSKGEQPTIQSYDIGVKDKTYKGINSAEQLITLILIEAMKPTALKGAAVYGAATVLGVAFLPAGVAGVLIGNDSAETEYSRNFDVVFNIAEATAKKLGTIGSSDKEAGTLKANVSGSNVTVKLEKTADKVKVTVSARKMLMPKPEVAQGFLDEMSAQGLK